MDRVDSTQEQMGSVNTVRAVKGSTKKEMLAVGIEAAGAKTT